MSLTDALGVKGNINQGQAAADEAIDRAKYAAQQTLAQANTDAIAIVSKLQDSLDALATAFLAVAQQYLAEIRKANESLAKFAALADKLGGTK